MMTRRLYGAAAEVDMNTQGSGVCRRMARRQPVWSVIMAAVMWVAPALCGTTGSVAGTIKGTSGMPIVGARITLTNSGMGIKKNATAGKNGSYSFPTLLPGQYELRAEAENFKPQTRTLVVHVNGALRVDLALEEDDKPGR